MKKIFALILVTCICITSIFPCTTFVLKTKKGLYFGRNLDWVSDLGLAIINQRNVTKTSLVFPPEKSIEWTSKYGSVTFNQFGKEFPFGGINEKGLVVEIMVSEAEYPDNDERPVVNELQWVQYQLDNCSSIKEVLATEKLIRVGQTHENLHYLICDAQGNTAVIEFIAGKMVSYTNDDMPVPVLENDLYEKSLEHSKNQTSCRFTKALDMIEKYSGADGQSAIDYCYKILEEVALSAEWSIVYDITNREIHFSTNSNREKRIISMNNFEFNCDQNVKSYDLTQQHTGNISNKFSKLKFDANSEILNAAMRLNAVNMEISQSNMVANYFNQATCNK